MDNSILRVESEVRRSREAVFEQSEDSLSNQTKIFVLYFGLSHYLPSLLQTKRFVFTELKKNVTSVSAKVMTKDQDSIFASLLNSLSKHSSGGYEGCGWNGEFIDGN